MSDEDADRYATWAFKAVMFILFGVFIVAILLFRRFPKLMLSVLGIVILLGVAGGVVSNLNPGFRSGTYSAGSTSPSTLNTNYSKGNSSANTRMPENSLTSNATATADFAAEPASGPKVAKGAVVQITGVPYDTLNIRSTPDPLIASNVIAKVRQGTRLEIVDGPVWVDTTSDDGQPVKRDWWLVRGWESTGMTGWCSGRYLQSVP